MRNGAVERQLRRLEEKLLNPAVRRDEAAASSAVFTPAE